MRYIVKWKINGIPKEKVFYRKIEAFSFAADMLKSVDKVVVRKEWIVVTITAKVIR